MKKFLLFLIVLYSALTCAQTNDSSLVVESKQVKAVTKVQQFKAVSDTEKLLAGAKKAFGFQPTTVQGIAVYGRLNTFLANKSGISGSVLVGDDRLEGSMIGIKGWEDLGRGYAALFMLEAGLRSDTGGGTSLNDGFAFDRSSFIGLLTPIGLFRLGRSGSPLGTYIAGNGLHIGIGRGEGVITGSIPGAGIDSKHPELSPVFNNGLYWDAAYKKFQFGAAVTTRGDQFEGKTDMPDLPPVNNEGKDGTKHAYGAYVIYKDQVGSLKYHLGSVFQVQNGTYYPTSNKTKFANGEAKRGWLIEGGGNIGAFKFNLAHNQNLLDNRDVPNSGLIFPTDPVRYGHSNSTAASFGWQINPADYVYLTGGLYHRKHSVEFFPAPGNIISDLTNNGKAITGNQDMKGWQLSLGYEHQLSKRTVLYADVRKIKVRQTCKLDPVDSASDLLENLACQNATDTVNKKLVGNIDYGYDIGISHTF